MRTDRRVQLRGPDERGGWVVRRTMLKLRVFLTFCLNYPQAGPQMMVQNATLLARGEPRLWPCRDRRWRARPAGPVVLTVHLLRGGGPQRGEGAMTEAATLRGVRAATEVGPARRRCG
jgi:hypothetical protein